MTNGLIKSSFCPLEMFPAFPGFLWTEYQAQILSFAMWCLMSHLSLSLIKILMPLVWLCRVKHSSREQKIKTKRTAWRFSSGSRYPEFPAQMILRCSVHVPSVECAGVLLHNPWVIFGKAAHSILAAVVCCREGLWKQQNQHPVLGLLWPNVTAGYTCA